MLPGGPIITPEDHVAFALRLGLDAVPCRFSWQPQSADLDDLAPAPSLADQLSLLERYLRAARGTGVGVIACFTSFFDSALRAVNAEPARVQFVAQQSQVEQRMDLLLANQERVMRLVCGRFASDLALVVIDDNVADHDGLRIDAETFQKAVVPRMRRLIAPAQEHGKLLLLHSQGQVDEALPLLYDIGFAGIHLVNPELNDLLAIKKQWAGRMALSGGIPTALLAHGTREQVEAVVREACRTLAPGGGYILGSSQGISKEVPLESLVALIRAVRRFSRYGSLGNEQNPETPGEVDS
jgi:uroporphyrinogen decarboxylase